MNSIHDFGTPLSVLCYQATADKHDESSPTCWCQPFLVCVKCKTVGHCLEGPAGASYKDETIIHKVAS